MYCISSAHVFVKLSTRKVFEQHQLSWNLFRVMRSFGYRAKTWRLVSSLAIHVFYVHGIF